MSVRQPPADITREQLGFSMRSMVAWLSPRTLTQSAVRVGVSSQLGLNADKRELIGVVADQPLERLPNVEAGNAPADELWFDYAADTGDGFDSTYSVASLLASESLKLTVPQRSNNHETADDGEGAIEDLPRGQLLVLGGDQVYPYASMKAYTDRFIGPFSAALPELENEEGPLILALPGNHDWYDGLTSFMRIFGQGGRIGNWQTFQKRSYFAVRLSPCWVLWAVDTQLDSYVDFPQYTYFQAAAAQLKDGDGLIVCTSRPEWVIGARPGREESYRTVDYLDRKVIRPSKATVRLWISGDEHHYARYEGIAGSEAEDQVQWITCGGAGAFTSATHGLPEALTIPPAKSVDPSKSIRPVTARFRMSYPTRRQSARLRLSFWRIPVHNRTLTLAFSGLAVLLSWPLLTHGTPTSISAHIDTAVHSPGVWLSAAILVVLLVKVVGKFGPLWHRLVGLAHAAVHLSAMVAVAGIAAWPTGVASLDSGWGFGARSVALVVALAGVVFVSLLALYFAIADSIGVNTTEFFSALACRRYKGFLRIHIKGDIVTVYPVGLAQPGRKWRLAGGSAGPWLAPSEPLQPHVIESPISIRAVPRTTGTRS